LEEEPGKSRRGGQFGPSQKKKQPQYVEEKAVLREGKEALKEVGAKRFKTSCGRGEDTLVETIVKN